MKIIGRPDAMDESTDENRMSDETVSVVLEEAEIVDCDAEVEAETDDDNVQYHLFAVNRPDNTVTYKVLVDSDANRKNDEVSITPVNNAVQVITSSVSGDLYVLSDNDVTSETARSVLTPHGTKLQLKDSRSHVSPRIITSTLKKREERRRVTHNEVERRRRDNINNWISKLGKLLPDCNQNANGGVDAKMSFESRSKGSILARVCEYIMKLREDQEKLTQSMEKNSQLTEEAKNLRQVVTDLRKENSKLKAQITKDTNVFILGT